MKSFVLPDSLKRDRLCKQNREFRERLHAKHFPNKLDLQSFAKEAVHNYKPKTKKEA